MTPLRYAEVRDIEARWRTLTTEERATAAVLADDATDIIRGRYSDIDARRVAGSITDVTLTRIVAGMVKRAMLNAESGGLESLAEAAGTVNRTVKFVNPNGNLYLSAEDIKAIEARPGRKAFAVDLSPNVPPCWL